MFRAPLAALLLSAMLGVEQPARAQAASPHAIEVPAWFADSLLHLREDVRDAAGEGKRLMLYFGQDGCPYCSALMQTGFTQSGIVAKTRRHFVALALNIWGDRELTWIDGKAMREKDLARLLKIQFTPTLIFLDEKGGIVARVNGYYPPHRLEAALDYVAGRMEARLPFAEHMRTAVREAASGQLHDQPFFLPSPHDLRRGPGAKPLAVLFETPFCAGCDEMHGEGFQRPEVLAQLAKFDIVRLQLGGTAEVTTPGGRKKRAGEWARELRVAYVPSVVFFDARGREVFRIEAYVRPFHLAGAFDYVASGSYAMEPSFQRYLQARAGQLRARGQSADLWK